MNIVKSLLVGLCLMLCVAIPVSMAGLIMFLIDSVPIQFIVYTLIYLICVLISAGVLMEIYKDDKKFF